LKVDGIFKNMKPSTTEIQVKDLDHYGIIAGIIDEIGLVEKINELVGTHERQKITPGLAVKAMIINGLGMFSAPLYLFEKFFEGKATEHLLGEGVLPEQLNDDCLGRVLDKLSAQGLTEIFVTVALAAAKKMGVRSNSLHLDSSSFHVDGKYTQADEIEETETAAITITHGYSRDHRPDLKQFIIDLMCTGDGDVPLYLRVADGNESDRAIFAQLIREFNQEWDIDALFVADAALYSTENLEQMKSLRWLSRVPATIKQTQELLTLDSGIFQDSEIQGYRLAEIGSYYGKIKQRWLSVESEARKLSDLKQLEKRLSKHIASAQSSLRQLSQQQFACEADALKAAYRFEAQLAFYRLDSLQIVQESSYGKAGRPGKSQSPTKIYYQIKASLILHQAAVDVEQRKAGRFILATNILDSEVLSNSAVLREYKAQQSTERGFRFLKDPLFFTSSVFLKSPHRVAALAMVMGLCLLVYNLGQRSLRLALNAANQTIPNQLGKPISTPTLRWVFQCFMSVHLITFAGIKQITNLTSERNHLLKFLSSSCRQYYLLS
jgi:transposase